MSISRGRYVACFRTYHRLKFVCVTIKSRYGRRLHELPYGYRGRGEWGDTLRTFKEAKRWAIARLHELEPLGGQTIPLPYHAFV